MENTMQDGQNKLGGGSGGGTSPTSPHTNPVEGTHTVEANQIQLMSRPEMPPGIPSDGRVTIMASGMMLDGKVDVRGSKGVRITTGPPPLPPTQNDGINGVEVMTFEGQSITLQAGLIAPYVDPSIKMGPGPAGITVDGGLGPVTITSVSEICLQVAGGVSSITLTPAGIIIQGPLVMIN